MRERLHNLRAVPVLYLWTVGAALVFTGSTGLHPTLGRAWDAIATLGALALAVLPFVNGARLRAGLVGYSAFVILLHAEEWVRLTRGTPIGFGIATLWLAALIGLVAQVSADQEVTMTAKLKGTLE